MSNIRGLKFSKDHEWVKLEGNKAYIGISDHAQHALGEIVFVELPEHDAKIGAGDVLSVVESVKAASDVYSPVNGTVIEVNSDLEENPGNINEEPYENWIAVLELVNEEGLDALMNEEEYDAFCKEEE